MEEYKVLTKNNLDRKYALINMDLNKFEMFNDLYGYEEGNKLIKMLDALWREQLRDYECCGHRMADRFVVLLTYDDRVDLVTRLDNYRKRLDEKVDGKYKLNLILGIYELRKYEEDFESAFNRAMMAFSTVKNNPSNWMKFYDEAMEEGLVWERYVEDHFQTALENREFQVYYQAKVDAATGKVSGAEALVRWVRPDGTIVPPGRFISVLENNGSIAELDRYMFQEVLNHQKEWLEQGVPIVPVSVNLSRVQLAEQNFVSRYKDMLEMSELPSKYISLEFTESAMFDNEEVLRDTVDQLHSLGIKVLIDDFGVGYSSMMTLKSIPVDVMKMDKTFVDSIGDERGNKIVVGMIKFALSLGMSVTAEGVEDERQYQFLRSHNCHDIQGYYFAKPIPAHEYCDKYLLTA
jgi:EAL domain-containing protein (putative c-di-GMP-specific phosphodiesterase class I)/GGDEF domain-containing protein